MSLVELNGVMLQSYADLLATLTYLLDTTPPTPRPVPYGYEGIPFTPPGAGLWSYATVVPVSSDQRLQTADKYIRILQIDCNDEMNIGTGRLTALCDQIMAYYKPRRLFSLNAQKLRVKKSDDAPVRIYGGYQSVALSITFDGSVDREFS
jgi:hypothetical protein